LSSAVATIPDAPATAAHDAIASAAFLPQAPIPTRPVLSPQGQHPELRRPYPGKILTSAKATYVQYTVPFMSMVDRRDHVALMAASAVSQTP
jgi:hypothetical protein